MENQLIIRKYHPTDKPAVLAILRLNTPIYFSPEEEADFVNYLNHEIELYYVTLINETIVGAGGVNFNQEKTIGIISWGMIHPHYQRKQIGSALLQHRIAQLQTMKTIEQIIVRTSHLVYKFYEKNGFELKEVVKDYWAKDFDLYSMVYKLRR